MNAVYGFFRTEWPESYTSLDSRIEHQYKSNHIRTLVGFRGLPVAVVVFLISEMIDRTGGYVLAGLLGMTSLYLLSTTARAVFDVLKRPRHPNYKFIVLHQGGQVCIVLFFAWIGLVSQDLWGIWIPSGEDLAIAIFAGSFASVMAIWTRGWLTASRLPFTDLVAELRKDIGQVSLDYAYKQSLRFDQSGNLGCLVHSILLA